MARLQRQGYARVRVNGVVQEIEAVQALARYKKHTIEAVVDRLKVSGGSRSGND
jgi:excinuclease ABC subunit A